MAKRHGFGWKLLACSSAALMLACSSSRSDSPSFAPIHASPAVTEIGFASGPAQSVTIGAAGGALSSADGMLTIEFPAGALTADTTVRITPIGDMAPGAAGSYRLEPEGTTFEAPVTLRFNVGQAKLEGTTPEALRIATQTAERTWRVLDAHIEGDSLVAQTSHFSDYSMLIGWQIRPATDHVKTNATKQLSVRYCAVNTDEDLVALVAECQEDDEVTPLLANWSVNGVRGGNSTVGSVSVSGSSIVYQAPSSLPKANPVAVSVEIGVEGKRATMVSNLQVVDAAGYTGALSFSLEPRGSFDYQDGRIDADATVEWALFTDNYNGARWYKPTGSVHAKYVPRRPECQLVEDTYPIVGGDLFVYPASGGNPGKYRFRVFAQRSISVTCPDGVQEGELPLSFEGCIAPAGEEPTWPFTDEAILSGATSCPGGTLVASQWEFHQ